MEIKIIESFEDFLAIREEWNEAVKKSSSSFFLLHEWLSNWWQHFGAGHRLFVITLRENGRIKALAPFMINVLRAGPFIIDKKLQFMAHDVSDYMDLIIVDDAEKCFEEVFGVIKKNSADWNWAELIYIAETSPYMQLWEKAGRGFDKCIKELRDVSVIIDLSGHQGWEGYFKSLNKKVRSDIVRQENNIGKAGKLEFEVASGYGPVRSIMNDFFEIHKKRWAEKKMPSQFGDGRLRERYLSLAVSLEKEGIVELSSLKLDSKTIALHYGFVFGGRYYWYTPAFDPEYQKFSPGKLLLSRTIKSAMGRGIKTFDLLRGEERYKFFWTNKKIDLYRFIFLKKSRASRLNYYVTENLRTVLKKSSFERKIKNIASGIRK